MASELHDDKDLKAEWKKITRSDSLCHISLSLVVLLIAFSLKWLLRQKRQLVSVCYRKFLYVHVKIRSSEISFESVCETKPCDIVTGE